MKNTFQGGHIMTSNTIAVRRFSLLSTFFAVAVLSGCATSQPAYLQDASAAHQVECHGLFGSWDSCSAQAAALCNSQTYQVLGRNHLEGASQAQAEAEVAGQSFKQRSMLVQCNPQPNPVASL
jgi:hypothetical protein